MAVMISDVLFIQIPDIVIFDRPGDPGDGKSSPDIPASFNRPLTWPGDVLMMIVTEWSVTHVDCWWLTVMMIETILTIVWSIDEMISN